MTWKQRYAIKMIAKNILLHQVQPWQKWLSKSGGLDGVRIRKLRRYAQSEARKDLGAETGKQRNNTKFQKTCSIPQRGRQVVPLKKRKLAAFFKLASISRQKSAEEEKSGQPRPQHPNLKFVCPVQNCAAAFPTKRSLSNHAVIAATIRS